MIILKIVAITAIVLIILFVLTLIIYFFNLDMKFAACLIKPLTAYYNWSGNRRKKHKEKQKEKQQG
uniref:hypothetical protein n=1 Tax=Lachnospira sp. TaxID=2049031 RepID=UPI003FF07ED5